MIGTAVLDTIRRPASDEAPVHAPGGILYSLAAFEARPPEGWTLFPIVKVGHDGRETVDGFLGRLTRLGSREGIRYVDEPNNRVELVYARDGSRSERLTGGVPGWGWEELGPLAATCDALYVNLIAGWELERTAAERLRQAVSGPVYCDLHSLLLDVGDDGVRRPSVPEDWRAWTVCFDYLQVNRDELELLAADAEREPWTLARELVGDRPRLLFVTLGPDGAAWVGEDGNAGAAPRRERVPLDPSAVSGDATGCGDVWGMSCFGSLLEGDGPGEAVRRANALARRNAGLSGADALLEAAAG